MSKSIIFNFIVDKENKQIKVERSFNAPLDQVWAAWTEAEILDQWWAPKPWKSKTKSLNFTPGGQWHYAMVGPNGESQWCLLEYNMISPKIKFSGLDAFCDEHAIINDTKPRCFWESTFTDDTDSTTVTLEMKFNELSDLEIILKMGFKEGFTMGLENLDELLTKRER